MSDADRTALEQWATRRDAEAFNALASRHAGMVYATCRRVLGNATEAEDVAQECFEALAQVGKARKARSLGAWLHGMATKRALQRLRSEKRRKAREARFSQGRARAVAPAGVGEPVWDDVYEHVDAAIAALPEKMRGPVVAHFLEGQSHTAVARNLGESRQTVAYRIKTGIDHIRASLQRRGVLVTGNTLGGLLAEVPVETVPETLTPALGKLALSGVGPSAKAATLSGLLTVKNYIIAGVLLAMAGVGAWVALTPRTGEPDGQPLRPVGNEGRASVDTEDEEDPVPQPEEPVAASTPSDPGGDAIPLAAKGDTSAPAPEVRGRTEGAHAPALGRESQEVAQAPTPVQQRQDAAGWVHRAAKSPLETSPVGALAALEIELPDPSFSGTPLDYWSPNFEVSFKPRPDFPVPDGTVLLSRGRPVTCSDVTVVPKKLAMVTDGDKRFDAECVLTLKPGVQYIQLDLGDTCALRAIVVWHFHEYERVYHDLIVVVSDDPSFGTGEVVFNNDHDNSSGLGAGEDKEYVEKAEGKLIDVRGAVARYVRLYSNGNSSDDASTYIEVDVYGRPVE